MKYSASLNMYNPLSFFSLFTVSPEQQKEYFEEQEANYWIDYYKEHPQYE